MALTPDELLDLGRWYFVQFADEAAAEAAMDRYQRYLERQRESYRIANLERTERDSEAGDDDRGEAEAA
jgi:hypothetical protein